jgi:hypothetical protein
MTATLRERYALGEVSDGGLLMDVGSGAIFLLNQSAAAVWRGVLAGRDLSSIGADLAGRYGLPAARARDDVDAALALPTPPAASVHTTGTELFAYRRVPAGYELAFRGTPALRVDAAGTTVTALDAASARDHGVDLLHALAPKLIALRGGVVLHAAAALVRGGAVVFSGPSGAGKTTAAGALAAAGATSICRDMLVLGGAGERERAGEPEGAVAAEAFVATAAEPAIDAWVERSAAPLAARGAVEAAPLDAALAGPRVRLHEVAFISADRRAGGDIAVTPLAPLDAAAALFENAFYGSDEPRDWRRQLAASCRVAGAVRAFRATMPDGLTALADAATRIVAAGTLTAP